MGRKQWTSAPRRIVSAQCARTVRTEAAQMLAEERATPSQFKKKTRTLLIPPGPLFALLRAVSVVLQSRAACGREAFCAGAARWRSCCVECVREYAKQVGIR